MNKVELVDMYLKRGMSAFEIAETFGCSQNKINYWLNKFKIQKRTISDAVYLRCNPQGDPFVFTEPLTQESSFLYGLGLGLYWGEGNKRNKTAVRLGNTDPRLVKMFIKFLRDVYHVKKEKFRFGLQIFSDMNREECVLYWVKALGFPRDHFGKPIVTPARSLGTYRYKTVYGVLTVYVSNRKLRDILCRQIEML